MPLSVGWLRFRLRALTGDGGTLVERDGQFSPSEEPGSDVPGVPASWMVDDQPPTTHGDAVMRAVRDVLVLHEPMRPRDIVAKLPTETVELATAFWKDGLERFSKRWPTALVRRRTSIGVTTACTLRGQGSRRSQRSDFEGNG